MQSTVLSGWSLEKKDVSSLAGSVFDLPPSSPPCYGHLCAKAVPLTCAQMYACVHNLRNARHDAGRSLVQGHTGLMRVSGFPWTFCTEGRAAIARTILGPGATAPAQGLKDSGSSPCRQAAPRPYKKIWVTREPKSMPGTERPCFELPSAQRYKGRLATWACRHHCSTHLRCL